MKKDYQELQIDLLLFLEKDVLTYSEDAKDDIFSDNDGTIW